MSAAQPDPDTTVTQRAGEQARNGWGPIPLPTGRKKTPPDKFTGQHPTPTYADYYSVWEESGGRLGNLAARIPENVVGVDVDAYDGKHGRDTWALLDGDTWPPTIAVSARFGPGYDGTSAIRFYRLPTGITQDMLWGAHDGIEILRHGHRYAMSPGSIHPEGGTYRCLDMRTKQFIDTLPPVGSLPELPTHLANLLTTSGAPWATTDTPPSPRDPDPNPMCTRTLGILTRSIHDLTTSSSRYDQMTAATWSLLSAEDEGHHLGNSLDILKLAYIAVTGKDRREQNGEPPASEYDRAVTGARTKIAQDPTDDMFRGCCTSNPDHSPPEPVTPPEPPTTPATSPPDPDTAVELTPYERVVRQKYADLRVHDDAKAMLAAHKAGTAPPLDGINLATFLAQPDEPENYRVDGLWPADGRVLLAAAAKSGKTTLVAANLIPAIVDNTPFLGRHPTSTLTGTIVLLNMEVSARTLRRWMRDAGIHATHKVVIANLRGKAAALAIATPQGRLRFATWLASVTAEIVILDPLAPLLAALGLDENSNTDIALFFSWWGEALTAAGVTDDLVVHHTGHAGQRSRGASRLLDEPDAVWTLTKDGNEEGEENIDDLFAGAPPRFLSAYGRDVEMAAEELSFDPDTRNLTLSGVSRAASKGRLRGLKVEEQVRTVMADGDPRTRSGICKEVSGKRGTVWDVVGRLIAEGVLFDTTMRRSGQVLYAWATP